MAVLKLHFNEGTPCELQQTEFTTGNGAAKSKRSSNGNASFAWTIGVKSLCLCLVEYKLWFVRGGVAAGFDFRGRKASPAASLDAALSKWESNRWLQDLFNNGGGALKSTALFRRNNPEGKRKSSPISINIITSFLEPANVSIYCGGKELLTEAALSSLLKRLKDQWKGAANEEITVQVQRVDQPDSLLERNRQWDGQKLPIHKLAGFRMVEAASPLIRKEHQSAGENWLFSLEEYADHLPAAREAADSVIACLTKRRCCYVSSLGSTGKTTLAIQLAVTGKLSNGPAFYLSLRDQAGRQDAVTSALVELNREQVLIILDDIHLAPQLADWLLSVWRNDSPQARLLLLGRTTTSPGNAPNSLSVERDETVDLGVSEGEMREIFLAQLNRLKEPIHPEITVVDEFVARWKCLFGADLMCFAQAIATRAEVLAKGDFELCAADTRSLFNQRWRDGAGEAEERELLRLALFSAFGLTVPDVVLNVGLLRGPIASGLVQSSKLDGFVQLGVCDPGLAELILDCAVPEVDKAELFVEVADRFPYFALTAMLTMEGCLDLRFATQPFVSIWNINDLMRSSALRSWVDRYQLTEIATMLDNYSAKGFVPSVILRELGKIPNPWPNHPYRGVDPAVNRVAIWPAYEQPDQDHRL